MTDLDGSYDAVSAGVMDRYATHSLKVVPPYMDALIAGDKTFEVRKNDRAYQRGDLLLLHEWHPAHHNDPTCKNGCNSTGWSPHYAGRKAARWVSYVYTGDPRFGGIEPGCVVLGLRSDQYTEGLESL